MSAYSNACEYVDAIRNQAKRKYANRYLRYRMDGPHMVVALEEPERDGLSYMAAQAVRMRIDELLSC